MAEAIFAMRAYFTRISEIFMTYLVILLARASLFILTVFYF